MSFRFNPFFKRRRRKLVKPIRGNPFDNIPKWLYEKTIRQRDPLTRKTRKTKDKKINIPNLQRTLTTLKNKVNEMIEWITRIPIVEQRMEQLEEQYERDIADIRSRLAGHSQGQTHSRYGSSDEDDDFPSYQTGGRVRTLPKPINQQQLNEYLHNQLDSYYDSYYENYDKPKSFTKPKPTQSSSTKLYYVKYTTRLTPQQLNEEKSRGGLTSIKHATKRTDLIPSAANVVIVEGGDINQIKQDPNVVLVEEAPTITYHDEINDPFYNNNFTRDQLYLEYIGHRDAIEEFGFGSHSPLLGMMDGSVLSENLPFTDKPPHPDLQGKVTYYQDTNDITVLSQNNIGHRTAVASIITTNTNNEWGGMGGTCPNCSLVYFDSLYSGDGLFPLLEGGLELGVRAANISMGGTQEYWDPGSQIIQDAINDAYNQGLILIVSAGNDDIDIANEFHTYCSYDNTLCVTTSNQYNTDSSGNFINVSAPLGECAACPYSNCSSGMDEFGNSVGSNPAWFRGFNGTSSSAPVVTGLVGLLLSHNPDLTSQDIYDIVTSTNINSSVGNRPGTINFYEALSYMYENYMEDVEPPLGDMNQDGIVNILDAVNLVNLILEVGEIDSNHPQYIPQGDINQDGSIDILDVVNLINMILSNQNTSQRDRRLLERQLKRLSNTIQVGDIVKDMNPN